jgi:hypothetical protein
MICIDGEVVRGLRAANETLKKQIPLIAIEFPEIKNCHPASINLKMECELRIDHPDHETGLIEWNEPPGEKFGFLRIGFEFPLETEPRKAWIYIPHDSPHFANRSQVEVITTAKLDGLGYGSLCRIHLRKGHVAAGSIVV